MMNNQKLSIEKLAECLSSFIELLTNDKKIHRLILEIARQTLSKSRAGQDTTITTKELFLELFPGQNEANASSILANIWKNTNKLQNEVSGRLTEHAFNQYGLDVYPWVEKIDSEGGAGNLVKYRLVGIMFDKSSVSGPNPYRNKLAHDIEYMAVKDLKPSFLARLFFDSGYEITGYKKWIMIFYPLVKLVFYLFMIVVLFIALRNESLANLSIYKIGLLIMAVWLFWNTLSRFQRFTDDRIIMASDHLMGWNELSLVQELINVNDENDNFLHKKVRLTKYVGICPICRGRVELDKGEPDFPRRIIGRCKESPREHVYSFDRITKLGNSLRNSRCEVQNSS